MMTAAVAVHQCLFCPQVFDSAPAKDDHILEHFAQEVCTDCNQNLIRIGSNLYTLHDTKTCIKRDESSEKLTPKDIEPNIASVELPCENRYEVNNGVKTEAEIASGFEEILIKIEAEDEPEPQEEQQQDQLEYIILDSVVLPDDNNIQPDPAPQNITVEETTPIVIVAEPAEPEVSEPAISEPAEPEPAANNDAKPETHMCDVCGETFDGELFLESHRKLKHKPKCVNQKPIILPKIETPLTSIAKVETINKTNFCDICGQPFDCQLFLESHKKLKHGLGLSHKRPKPIDSTVEPKRIADIQTNKTSCDICGQPFDCELFLESHKKLKHSSVQIDPPKDIPRKKAGKSNVRKAGKRLKLDVIKPEKKFECLICYKMYSSEFSLRTHVETIHDPSARKFPCSLCDQAFFRECALQAHHEQVHLNLKNFECSFCNVRLKSKAALKRHTYQHTGERPVHCLWAGCEKTFSCSSNRDEHMRSHTGEKPFHCTIDGCDNRFSFAADFRKHKFVAHNIYTNKFTCEICSAIFPQKSMLKKHLQKHDNDSKDNA